MFHYYFIYLFLQYIQTLNLLVDLWVFIIVVHSFTLSMLIPPPTEPLISDTLAQTTELFELKWKYISVLPSAYYIYIRTKAGLQNLAS